MNNIQYLNVLPILLHITCNDYLEFYSNKNLEKTNTYKHTNTYMTIIDKYHLFYSNIMSAVVFSISLGTGLCETCVLIGINLDSLKIIGYIYAVSNK